MAKAGEFLVQGQPGLYSETPCHKQTNNKKKVLGKESRKGEVERVCKPFISVFP
jgi:hypothetical protein